MVYFFLCLFFFCFELCEGLVYNVFIVVVFKWRCLELFLDFRGLFLSFYVNFFEFEVYSIRGF